MSRPHPENLIAGEVYLLILDEAAQFPGHVEGHGGEELVGAVVLFRGLELHRGRLHVAVQFADDMPDVEHWVAWEPVRHVLEPREEGPDAS